MHTKRTLSSLLTLVTMLTVGGSIALGQSTLPEIPYSPTPYSNTTNVSTTKVLSWISSRATGYDVYLGTTATPAKVATVLLPSYTPTLKPGTKYYWKVVAKNSYGTSTSIVWNFTTTSLTTSSTTTASATSTSTSTSTAVNCVTSAWVLKSATAWSTCTNGLQTRTETWVRTVLVQPSNGGTACGPLTDTRTGTQSCGSAPQLQLLNQSSLVYEGAFRVPNVTSSIGAPLLNYGGTALTYVPGRDSLLMLDGHAKVAEISVPVATKGAALTDLPRAAMKQNPTDVLQGKIMTIDGDTQNGVKIGGLVPLGNSLVVSAWSYYDAGVNKQIHSHFVTGMNFSALPPVTGPFQVGTGFQNVVPTDMTRIGGFVSGYMSTIPNVWQPLLGGTHLTGQGGKVSILVRTSSGPSATVFTPTELGVPNSPTALVMGYPTDTSNPGSPLHHPTLGQWGVDGGLYNGTQGFRGMVFPENSRSILFFGWGGTRFCYGAGTSDPKLDLQPVPGYTGVHYCYDPTDSNKGTHGYPSRSLVFAYDANDFVAVKQGLKKPWDVKPYATWSFSLPFQQKLVNGVDLGVYDIIGAAYDPAGRRLFVAASMSDGALPLIHVFRLP